MGPGPDALQAGTGVSLVPADGRACLAQSTGAALGQQPLPALKRNLLLQEARTTLPVVLMQNSEEVNSAP